MYSGSYNQISLNEGETGPAMPLLKSLLRAHEDKLAEIPVRLKHPGLAGFDPEIHKTLLDLVQIGIWCPHHNCRLTGQSRFSDSQSK